MKICESLINFLTKTYESLDKKSKLKSNCSIHAVHGQYSISRKEKVDESWEKDGECVWLQDERLLREIGEKNYLSEEGLCVYIQKWALFINFEKSGTHSECR